MRISYNYAIYSLGPIGLPGLPGLPGLQGLVGPKGSSVSSAWYMNICTYLCTCIAMCTKPEPIILLNLPIIIFRISQKYYAPKILQ